MASTKLWKFPPVTWTHNYPESSGSEVSPSLYVNISQSQSRQHQPMGGRVSYPTESPTATGLGLCSSLDKFILLPLFDWLVWHVQPSSQGCVAGYQARVKPNVRMINATESQKTYVILVMRKMSRDCISCSGINYKPCHSGNTRENCLTTNKWVPISFYVVCTKELGEWLTVESGIKI